jgi:hypothetical protein
VLSAHFIKNNFGQLIWVLLKVDTIVWEPSMISWMSCIDGSKQIARRRRYAHSCDECADFKIADAYN